MLCLIVFLLLLLVVMLVVTVYECLRMRCCFPQHKRVRFADVEEVVEGERRFIPRNSIIEETTFVSEVCEKLSEIEPKEEPAVSDKDDVSGKLAIVLPHMVTSQSKFYLDVPKPIYSTTKAARP